MRTSVLIVCFVALLCSGGCGSKEPRTPPTAEEMAQQKREVQAEDALNMAMQLEHNGEYLDENAALEYLNKALSLDPAQVEALYQRAIIFLNRGDLDRSLADVQRVIELKPSHVKALFTRAFIHYSRKDCVAAVHSFSRVLDEDNTISQAYSMRGHCYDTMGRVDDAIHDYSQAIALNPALQNAYYYRGLAYMRTGEDELALHDLTQAVSLDSLSTDALKARAEVSLRLAEFERAATDFQRLTVMMQADSAIYGMLAEALAGSRQFGKAAVAAGKAKRLATAEGDLEAAQTYADMVHRYRAELLAGAAEPDEPDGDEAE